MKPQSLPGVASLPLDHVVTSRSELLRLLTEACELEHGLASSYLYTAFTLKQDLGEGGIEWRHLQQIRYWAGQIYAVAAEEMLHLAQAWNLLSAIGGAPYYLRPNFPQPSRYYPLALPLLLEPFGVSALRRFIAYERPEQASVARACPWSSRVSAAEEPQAEYRTVGQLYRLIMSGFETIPEQQLFVGSPETQIGPDLVDFPDIIQVVDRDSAIAAINTITEQGEGTVPDREDCHFGMFVKILAELEAEMQASSANGVGFAPARNAACNPVVPSWPGPPSSSCAGVEMTLVTDPFTREVSALFDSVYGLMLRMLQYVFDNNTRDEQLVREFARMAIEAMLTVIKPLGEALTLLPAQSENPALTAGPSFGLTRHVPLPLEPRTARILARERLTELTEQARTLAEGCPAIPQLRRASTGLHALWR